MSSAELLPEIQALPRVEQLRLVKEIMATLELEERLNTPMPAPWERDPKVAQELRESIAQAKAGNVIEMALIDP